MDVRVLIVVLWLWSSGFFPGLQTDENDTFKGITDVRLVRGSGRCSGLLQLEHQGVWKEVNDRNWDLKLADVVCRNLDCGSVVQTVHIYWKSAPSMRLPPSCLESESGLRKCVTKRSTIPVARLGINCSDSIRLVNGTSLCSGRLEVKSDQSHQSWSSVCEDDFDQQDAKVVCRELGCGAPSVLQGALYGDGEAPMWTKEFQCGGNESVLLDCGSSVSNSCSSGKAVGLTCSEPDILRLGGGSSRCDGELEMKQMGEWRKVTDDTSEWNLKMADVMCRQLDCGSAVSTGNKMTMYYRIMWLIRSTCLQPKTAVRECLLTMSHLSTSNLEIKCSESIRLVNGTSLCSGRLEVKSDQSHQSWSSVCEDDFDQQDAKVVCRELGCGAPSVLQGALYGDGEAPMWTKEFQCGGNESVLLDCGSSVSNSCSSGKAVGLTCSEPDEVRLVGGSNHCVGGLELKHKGDWRPVDIYSGDLMFAAVVCRQLDCGSALSIGRREDFSHENALKVEPSCGHYASTIRECVLIWPEYSSKTLEVTCSDFLVQPNISFATHTDGVSKAVQQGFQVLMGSEFTISCSTLPQHPGGSFQLIFSTSNTAQNYTLPAVNHSAHFLFPAADSTHRGEYRCAYHLYVFSHNLSSESQPLRLTVLASVTHLLIRLVVMVLMVVSSAVLFCYWYDKQTEGRRQDERTQNTWSWVTSVVPLTRWAKKQEPRGPSIGPMDRSALTHRSNQSVPLNSLFNTALVV